ncbi:hypothetical protein BV22DRAFT_267090 [Leucogyrophana mollusca]|uniref:Uncharacterized protein n=1 Tax=Leucogyrophana mollusca TaxID=85980 RepID=A0ACB8BNU0_9AGAM|nr:hypothetical protein BV22DRAFT_267090 [Leucogyrophana mollusca]
MRLRDSITPWADTIPTFKYLLANLPPTLVKCLIFRLSCSSPWLGFWLCAWKRLLKVVNDRRPKTPECFMGFRSKSSYIPTTRYIYRCTARRVWFHVQELEGRLKILWKVDLFRLYCPRASMWSKATVSRISKPFCVFSCCRFSEIWTIESGILFRPPSHTFGFTRRTCTNHAALPKPTTGSPDPGESVSCYYMNRFLGLPPPALPQ